MELNGPTVLGNLAYAASIYEMPLPDIPEACFNADGSLGDKGGNQAASEGSSKRKAKRMSTDVLREKYRSTELILKYQEEIMVAHRYIRDAYNCVKAEGIGKVVTWPKRPKDLFTLYLINCCQATEMPLLKRIDKSPKSLSQFISACALMAHWFCGPGEGFYLTNEWFAVRSILLKAMAPGRPLLDNPRALAWESPKLFHPILEPTITAEMARFREARLAETASAMKTFIAAFEKLPHLYEPVDEDTVRTNPPNERTVPCDTVDAGFLVFVAVSVFSRVRPRIRSAHVLMRLPLLQAPQETPSHEH
jgi:hypothetical protein